MKLALLFTVALAASAQPVRLHPDNPHYLQFRAKPLVVVTSAEHYGAVLNLDFNLGRYLDTLRREGMNYTRIFSGEYVEPPGAFGIQRNTLAPRPERFLPPWVRSETPGYANGGNKFDLERWNPAYFTRLRDFVSRAADAGVIVEMTLFCSTYGDAQWRVHPFNPANNVNGIEIANWRDLHTLANARVLAIQERLVRKIVEELNGFDNVIYEIQNEPWADRPALVEKIPLAPGAPDWADKVEAADKASLEWQARVAQWISDAEAKLPNRHLIAQNYSNFRARAEGIAPQVSIVNFHYAHPEAVTMNYARGKLIAYDESGFAGSADATYRREAWRFLLAGGGAFNNLDYSFTVGREDGSDTDANGPGGGSPELRRQLRVLREFLESFEIARLRPAGAGVRNGCGNAAHVLADTGRAYAMYVSTETQCQMEIDAPAGSWLLERVEPDSGLRESTTVEHGGGPLRIPIRERESAYRIVRQQPSGQ